VGFISGMLVEKGLPGFIAYGVLIGEVVAPILIIVGLFTRPAALVLAFTMIVAWLMVGMGETLALDKVGAWAIESLVYFFIGSLAVAFLGAGRFALGKHPRGGRVVGRVNAVPAKKPGGADAYRAYDRTFTVYARTRSPCGWHEHAST
jgi:hypothetical protein